MRKLLNTFTDFFYLFYPHLCLACGENAPPYSADVCITCEANLPLSGFHQSKENPFTERFWGRLPIEAGAGLYLFTKKSKVANLIHNFKYKGKREIGTLLGKKYGSILKKAEQFQGIDYIVPVPLHWKKERQRGFNQSEIFGNGLADEMGVPCIKDGLIRVTHTTSQTKKNRAERIANMKGVFAANKKDMLSGKHILLVDDVLTTGATLEVCANELLKLPGTKISMATIAVAMV